MQRDYLVKNFLYILISALGTTFVIVLIFLIIAPVAVFLLLKTLPGSTESEGLFAAGIIASGISIMASVTGLIPSYLLSMRLAVYLREKRGWEIRHPRRMFALAMLMLLALPILLLLLAPLTK